MNTSETQTTPIRGDATREALIASAMAIFARDGFDAASTRAIAVQAGVNQALIGYHFGGKKGLYLATFDHMAVHLQARIGPISEELEALLANPPKGATTAARRKAWLPPILRLVDAALSMVMSPEMENWAELMVREQSHPTLAFDNIYRSFMGRTLELLVELVARLRDESDLTQAKLLVIGMLGQVIIWRTGRATATRLLDWQQINNTEIAQIKESLFASIKAQLLA